MYLSRYKSQLFKLDVTQRFLKTLGFEPATSSETLCLPYEKSLKRLVLARETLVNKV